MYQKVFSAHKMHYVMIKLIKTDYLILVHQLGVDIRHVAISAPRAGPRQCCSELGPIGNVFSLGDRHVNSTPTPYCIAVSICVWRFPMPRTSVTVRLDNELL